MTCNSVNVIYVLLCLGCLEKYIWETGAGKRKLKDRVRVYRQYIIEPEHQKLKVEEYIRIYGRGFFKTFLFLQMQSNDKNLRRAYESFKENTKLNSINSDRLKVDPEV